MANWDSLKYALSVTKVQKKIEDFVEKVQKKVKAYPLQFWPFLAKFEFFSNVIENVCGTSGIHKKVFDVEYNQFKSQNLKEKEIKNFWNFFHKSCYNSWATAEKILKWQTDTHLSMLFQSPKCRKSILKWVSVCHLSMLFLHFGRLCWKSAKKS